MDRIHGILCQINASKEYVDQIHNIETRMHMLTATDFFLAFRERFQHHHWFLVDSIAPLHNCPNPDEYEEKAITAHLILNTIPVSLKLA